MANASIDAESFGRETVFSAKKPIKMTVGGETALAGDQFERVGGCFDQLFCFEKADFIGIGNGRHAIGCAEYADDMIFAEMKCGGQIFQRYAVFVLVLQIGGDPVGGGIGGSLLIEQGKYFVEFGALDNVGSAAVGQMIHSGHQRHKEGRVKNTAARKNGIAFIPDGLKMNIEIFG